MKDYNTFNGKPYNKVKKNDFIRLFRDNKFIGFFSILDKHHNKQLDGNVITILDVRGCDQMTAELNNSIFLMNSQDESYTFDIIGISVTAGIMCIYNNKALMVKHNKLDEDNITYPKGSQNKGEQMKKTAIREFKEEVGIELPKKMLDDRNLYTFRYFNDSGKLKIQYFWVVNLSNKEYKRYFNTNIIPRENLPLDEIVWAGFMSKEELKPLLKKEFSKILNFII